MKKINSKNFFCKSTIDLAQNLIGKWIQTNINGKTVLAQIVETEAYLGISDSACHTFGGKKTKRTQPMWEEGGTIYVYLCYGIHNMFNIVSLGKEQPEAVLIRAVFGANGPGKASKLLNITQSLNGQSIIDNPQICILDDGNIYHFTSAPRVGIEFALPEDQKRLLRFILEK